jgi:hypothetical protein
VSGVRAPIVALLLALAGAGGCGKEQGGIVEGARGTADAEVDAFLRVAGTEPHDPDVLLRETERLAALGTSVVPALAAALDRPDVGDTAGAWIAEALARIGPDAAAAAPALGRRLAKGGGCSATTSHALELIGAPGVPWLAAALSSPNEPARVWASDALADLGPLAAGATDALVVALEDPSADVRSNAAHAAVAAGAPRERLLPALLRLADDEEEQVRMAALDGLVAVAPVDAATVDALERAALGDSSESVRWSALQALQDPRVAPWAIPLLRRVCEGGEHREEAVLALLSHGVDEEPFVTEAAAAARGRGPKEWRAAAEALGAAGPNGRQASVALWLQVLRWSPEAPDRVRAAEALAALGPVAADAVETLEVHADPAAEDPTVVAAAARALLAIRPR